MEAELRSCWAGRGTRAGAQENVLGSWELSGKLGAGGRNRDAEGAAPREGRRSVPWVAARGLGPPAPPPTSRERLTQSSRPFPMPPSPAPQARRARGRLYGSTSFLEGDATLSDDITHQWALKLRGARASFAVASLEAARSSSHP